MARFLAYIVLMLASLGANALNVTMDARAEGGDKPTIAGTTNLPDGIELMVTIRRKESAYMAQSKTRVKGGAFLAGPFSQKGVGLNPGTYTIEISSPLASLQPPPTWPVIGNDGTKLQGPLVRRSPYRGKVVEFRTSFTVGSGRASTNQDRAARGQAEKDQHAWWLASCESNCNIVKGLAKKRGEVFDWDRCYYTCVADEPAK